MRIKSRTRSSRPRKLGYAGLEERRLLAAIITGSEIDDRVEVTYVDANTVDVSLNDKLLEDVDISDGLIIKLLGGQDKVMLDHRITHDVVVLNSEELVIDGGDNQWFIGFLSTRDSGPSFQFDDVAGRVNDNIRFRGATTLRSGDGADEFTINTRQSYSVFDAYSANSFLNVYAGSGNDLFRFNQTKNPLGAFDGVNSVSAFGEGGDDRFVVLRINGTSNISGGDGFDVIDYSRSKRGARLSVGDFENGTWGGGNELIIGSQEFGNHFQSRSSGVQRPTLDWMIRGDRTVVTDKGTGAFIELRNFDSFGGDHQGIDNFWILETTRNVTIHDGDFVQISSEFHSLNGNLSTINHDILFRRSGPLIKPAGWTTTSTFPIDMDGVLNTRIVISDAMGDGVAASFSGDAHTISGLTGGKIQYVDGVTNHEHAKPYQPEIVVHGSLDSDDFFVFEETETPIFVFSHGGNDAFMFGSTNKSANGNIDLIDGEVKIYAGEGDDRLFVNDQAFAGFDARYELMPNVVRDGNINRNSDSPSLLRARRFAGIKFDNDLEVARVNGSATVQNAFWVVPSYVTQFVVDASAQTSLEDSLSITGFTENGLLIESSQQDGVWIYDDGKKPVHYFGTEAIFDREVQPMGLESTRVDRPAPILFDDIPDDIINGIFYN